MKYLVTVNIGNKKVTAITEYDLPMEPAIGCFITEGESQLSKIDLTYPSGQFTLFTSDPIPANANNTKAVSISVADM